MKFTLIFRGVIMSILFDKLMNTIGEDEIINRLGKPYFNNLKRNATVWIYHIYKKINLEKEVGYTYEDCLQDFDYEINKYKEKKAVYKIWKTGSSIYEYGIKLGLKRNYLYRMLRSGFDTVVNENIKYLLLDTFDIEYNLDDIKNFKVEVHEKFCKLIGSKEELEKVISKYEIDYPILCHNEQYSVAFNGPLFRKIKESYKDIIK